MGDIDCLEILKGLADRTRMRLIKALRAGPSGVNDLSERLDISQYNTSKHLRVLKEAGVVEVRAIGTRREYFIAEAFRTHLEQDTGTLDFGCCTFDFDQLPD